ncbi:MAG: hypothetical protein EOO00_03055 [Chitinophagaceae bacterium]|nr:MAG: hypothetical protein EOO00_03055 [Chitinophagaceae bacterium]
MAAQQGIDGAHIHDVARQALPVGLQKPHDAAHKGYVPIINIMTMDIDLLSYDMLMMTEHMRADTHHM